MRWRWGEKTPGNVFYIEQILEDFPNAQFVYIHRVAHEVLVADINPLIRAQAVAKRLHRLLAIAPHDSGVKGVGRAKLGIDELCARIAAIAEFS